MEIAMETTIESAVEGGTALFPSQVTLKEPHALYYPLKRVIDLFGAIIALFPLIIVLIIAGTLIFLEDGGPVIYRGWYVGQDGRWFRIWKIRTMRRDSETYFKDHPTLYELYMRDMKLKDDPRVLKIGRFLRRTSLDELPQAINVLRGDMSWVGPRPMLPAEPDRYGAFLPLRVTMRPGVTGLWQISGRSNMPYPLRAVYDRTYYYQRSLRMDIAILFATIPSVLRRDGAV
jgi:lipopolysaccharide/colanic/teichoic acid biosynthesis glycosyltransferase